jgi:16S rRNA (cytosine967-C5)-methyltransferase
MNEYLVIIDIIKKVLLGANLSDTFNNSIANNNLINISKVKDISYGVFRYYYQLLAIINQLVKKKNHDLTINSIFLILFYELNYTKKPSYSIVNTVVELTFLLIKNNQIKSFVNAVARNYIRNKNLIDKDANKTDEAKYNLPKWWINILLKNKLISNDKDLLKVSNSLPKICLRVNLRKISNIEYQKILNDNNINFDIIDGIIILKNSMNISKIPYFNEGFVSIQNISAQQLIKLIPMHFTGKILDACSAPGGKLSQLLENIDAKIDAIDIDQNRLSKIQSNLNRLNLSANLYCVDASDQKWFLNKEYDLIIADVPCSASGTIKTNPDIKVNRKLSDINNFTLIQRKIFNNLIKFVANKGYILYITCSIFPMENQDNIAYFLNKYKNLSKIQELVISIDNVYDGFYYCLLQKN